ncbi:MAG: carboxypeptidase regulatory-like domain-containing protein [Deltaproteobacteria bacterium]|nr:carboxypeptidase regulatory-like domain-containing protein [Deltaproteobacteria bacterium]
MRRRWGTAPFASIIGLVAAVPTVSAQPADVTASAPAGEESAPPQAIGYGAMPGGLHAPSAETLPKGAVQIAMLGGFGFRNGLLGSDHKLRRGIGNLAVAFAPHELLTIGLSLDGRYDKHTGFAPTGDDGYVGDPHLIVRAAKTFGNLKAGAQLGVWVPGKDAPSVAGSAISLDARGLISLNAGPGLLSLSAGFRLDNSAKSADATKLTLEDRVSLGVSEFHAVIGGVNLSIPSGKLFFGAEASVDVFLGSGKAMGMNPAHEAPGPLVRFGASAGYRITPEWAAMVFVEGARVPKIDTADVTAGDITLIAYEPTFTGGIGLTGRFGGPKRGSTIIPHDPVDITVIETADLSGTVTDENGKPLAGATVEIKAKTASTTATTDGAGAWSATKLPIGETVKGVTTLDAGVEITAKLGDRKPATTTMTLVKGPNTVAKLTLDPVLPPGQLRAVVRSLVTGRPLVGATVKIEPGGQTATSDAEGKFEVDLQPGSYKIKVSSPGLKDQELDVTIDPNGVAIKNIE